MEPSRCCVCNGVISRLRIEALGETPYCVRCSPSEYSNNKGSCSALVKLLKTMDQQERATFFLKYVKLFKQTAVELEETDRYGSVKRRWKIVKKPLQCYGEASRKRKRK